jgi:hypothetical protein
MFGLNLAYFSKSIGTAGLCIGMQLSLELEARLQVTSHRSQVCSGCTTAWSRRAGVR